MVANDTDDNTTLEGRRRRSKDVMRTAFPLDHLLPPAASGLPPEATDLHKDEERTRLECHQRVRLRGPSLSSPSALSKDDGGSNASANAPRTLQLSA